ncbi:FixH family protein [Arvimicrobium flavum]|uniref:FixH family protein n=1 Tax=Arvimicrobium flavum TaxID=3393320 RepID=UPI00237B417A|nr:FixH family protein [Mesorhizobium shangrilense]
MSTRQSKQGGFTGTHMLFIMLTFFGVIIGVNLTMAVFANTSWTGLVVKNSYVASQFFNEKLAEGREQAALGLTPTLTISDGGIGFRIADAEGRTVPASGGQIVLRRPAYEAEDATVPLAALPDGTLHAAHRVRDGLWIVDVSAEIGRERPYREGRRIVVKDGRLQ